MNPLSPPLRIRPLSEQLANQIAAGEVVERPASVLKELLENALDAGATQVEVEAEQGGVGLLRVRDNGSGIHRDDLTLAVSRHATSKISSLADLEALNSLGFRGEALASIGSVSRLRLVSATAGAEMAWSVEAAGRESVPQQSPASHPVGTSVEVADLFFNTPARRKFLRSEKTEFAHLEDVFRRAALSRFDVGFSLSHNGRPVYRLKPAADEAQRRRRLAEVCGKGFAEQALWLAQDYDGLHLTGWVTPPVHHRSSSDLQYFFLNGRMVRDRLLQHAIRQAYEGLLPEGRHAGYVLYLEMPATAVDVNVHPTKHEVRFQQARSVHDFLVVALRRALQQPEPPMGLQLAEATPTYRPPGLTGYEAAPARGPLPRQGFSPPPTAAKPPALAWGTPLTQVEGRYLLVQRGEAVVVVDVEAADRRLAAAALTRHAEAARPGVPLIFPAQFPLSVPQTALLERLSPLLARLGLEWGGLAAGRVVVRALPEALHHLDLERWLTGFLNRVAREPVAAVTLEAVCGALAAAAATARRYQLSQAEMRQLLERLQDAGELEGGEGELWRRLDAAALTRWWG